MPSISRTSVAFCLIALFSAGVIYTSLPDAAESLPSVASAATAPAFSATDLTGQRRGLEDFQQQVKILNFWATTCHACKLEIPGLQAIHQKYKDRGVAVIGMALDSDSRLVSEVAGQLGITYPVLTGTMEAARALHLRATPTTLILDGANRIIKTYVGVQGQATFERDIRAALDRSGSS